MASEIIKSDMKPSTALEILSNKDSYERTKVIEAFAVVSALNKELEDRIKVETSHIFNILNEDCYRITANNRVVSIDKVSSSTVQLTDEEKKTIYDNPEIFKDYIEPHIVPAKVKAAVLDGSFNSNGVLTVKASVKETLSVNVKSTK